MGSSTHWTHAKASITRPPAPITNFPHPRCYAKSLRDCSTKISREHYISENLLIKMGGKPQIAGFKFQKQNALKSVGVNSLTSKILCERHNNCLTALDDVAGNFFETLRKFDEEFKNPIYRSEEIVINGADLERWMLKVLLGMHHSSLIGTKGLREEILLQNILFGRSYWPSSWGLYCCVSAKMIHAFSGVELVTYTNDQKYVFGARINVAGFPFLICFGARPGGIFESYSYRPAGIILGRKDNKVYKKLSLGWPRRPRSDYVKFIRSGEYDGERPQDIGLVPE